MDSIRDRVITSWADFSVGNARSRVSVRDKQWCTSVGYEDENGDELFDLNTDSEEVHNVAIQHPDLAAIYRSEIESLLG